MKRRIFSTVTMAVATSFALAACSSPNEDTTSAEATTATSEAHDHNHDHEGHNHDAPGADDADLTEVSSLPQRVVLSHDKGLTTIDPATGEIVDEEKISGFHRLNPAGNTRHLYVSGKDGFTIFDTGAVTQPHGDHNHYYEKSPELTDNILPADKPGHVVQHDGKTALFDDGTGEITIFDNDELEDGTDTMRPAHIVTAESGDPHHGVAVPFKDGSYLTTVGTEDERHRIEYRSLDNEVLASTDDCPGIHGEAVAKGGNVAFGCTNGPIVFDVEAQEFHKVDANDIAKDGYQRSGNLAGSEDSPIVLGDNKTDEDADLERPTSVVLIDTTDYSMKTVELEDSYWFRSLGRTADGDGVVLTYDGYLNIIDVESGKVTDRIEVIKPWKEKDEWQQPGPILKVDGDIAYVTDAENKEFLMVDLQEGEVLTRTELDFAPVEMGIAR
ncbi:hypothetical protein QP924_09070 [Corynebacterium pseudodiphtheriticum]|uniref:hypothetical protein n=1 Tax=Corynebacterium pseudodiphtheriticum TaxID=37637 RepID=UPI00254B3776|nr:hypothetical protein [Corynebacterium pseudodiphtheriticum]MDK8700987.1 hypothetical protein [Corynebacterium pseudodiphtheriticum]